MTHNADNATAPNGILRRKTESSHRTIAEMQQEHQQLLQEMERLRRNAGLSRDDQQSQVFDNETRPRTPEIHPTEPVAPEAVSKESSNTQANTTDTTKNCNDENKECEAVASTTSSTEDEGCTQYLREKIAEIATMKAQLKRIQQMAQNTNLMENYLGRNDAACSRVPPSHCESNADADITLLPPIEAVNVHFNENLVAKGPSDTDNLELIMSMLTMFDEFKNDLCDQANTLRAERDRLKELKEELLRRKN